MSPRPKSDRTANAYLGVIPGANLYSSCLDAYCASCNPWYADSVAPQLGTPRRVQKRASDRLTPNLETALNQLGCILYASPDATMEFEAAVETYTTLRRNPIFCDLRQFLVNLSAFLNGCYSKSTTIEPFQQQLILHTFYFLISIKAPENTDQYFEIFKEYFGLFGVNRATLNTFRQKSSVFLIPRRHGKTWIVVAIVSTLLSSVEGLHVGYVAHQKHVASAVFSEVINTLCRWFPSRSVDVKKESGTVVFRTEGRRPSTLMCATCFNKNVRLDVLVSGSHIRYNG